MTDKPGRKALFTGAVSGANGMPKAGSPAEIPPVVETALQAAIDGDFSARIDLSGIPEFYKPFAASVNALLEKVAEEEEEIQHGMQTIENLRKSSDEIIQQNPMPMLVVDQQYRVSVTNEAFVKLTGIPRERVMQMALRDFTIVSQKGDGIKRVIAEKKKAFGEVVVEFPSGTFTLEQYGIPILDEKGELDRIMIVYNDVTKLREEEEELKAQMAEITGLQKQTEVLIEQNPMPMLVVDKEFGVTITNEAFVKLSGIPRERIMAMSLRDFKILSKKR